MTRKPTSLLLCLAGILAPTASGFCSDDSSLARSFNKTISLTNLPILVTATFTNGGTNALRGFVYSEQIPSGLAVSTVSVTLNGQGITNYVLESGLDGDVYPGCTPWRWVLERPTSFAESNATPPQATAQIVYSISSSVPSSFSLQEFAWAGYRPAETNVSFGYSADLGQQLVSILAVPTPPVMTGQWATDAFVLSVQGVPGVRHVIEASTDLAEWVPLWTNTSPFTFTDFDTPLLSSRFYRARWLR